MVFFQMLAWRTVIILLHLFSPLCRKDKDEPVSLKKLRDLGVLYWKLDADAHETDPKLAAIRKERGYSYQVGCLIHPTIPLSLLCL